MYRKLKEEKVERERFIEENFRELLEKKQKWKRKEEEVLFFLGET